ncbi:hypothetical protein HDV64DRAFT_256190 [Trichoderma sp. TUCIM 5745]
MGRGTAVVDAWLPYCWSSLAMMVFVDAGLGRLTLGLELGVRGRCSGRLEQCLGMHERMKLMIGIESKGKKSDQ